MASNRTVTRERGYLGWLGLAATVTLGTACGLGGASLPDAPPWSGLGAANAATATATPAAVSDCLQPACSHVSLPISSHVVRLTHPQWELTMRDLLQLPAAPGLSSSFPADPGPPHDQFGTDSASLIVTYDLWFEYRAAAEALADLVVGDPAAVARLLPATAKTGSDTARVQAFVADFLPRAYRRPVSAAEINGIVQLGEQAVASDTTSDPFLLRLRWVLAGILQQPALLYRLEGGAGEPDANARVHLNAYELASKLSYALWGTMPDAALTQAAASGKLKSTAGLAEVARAMLADPRAGTILRAFHDELFNVPGFSGVARTTANYPKFYARFPADAQEDVRRTIDALVVDDAEGNVKDLFASTTAFVNGPLAGIYGIDPASVPGLAAHPETFVRVALDPAQRTGILAHVGWLAMQGKSKDPATILRGVYMARQVLCINLGSPPAGAAGADPSLHYQPTDRQRVEDTTNGCGTGCHSGKGGVINPLGFGFEAFDALGQFRTTDNNVPVDASGTLTQLGSFTDAVSMLAEVGDSSRAHACYAAHWSSYLNGISNFAPTAQSDWLSPIVAKSMKGAPIREIIVELILTDAFRTISQQ